MVKPFHEIDLDNAPLEELEKEMRERDEIVQILRTENVTLKKAADKHHVRLQTEAAGRAPQNLTRTVNFELGGKQ